MKILCETTIVKRFGVTNQTPRSTKATVAIGYNQTSKDSNGNSTKEIEIIHFTAQNRNGVRYKTRNNIVNIFSKFVLDGKATISFRQPEENLMIKCDPIQLKCFLHTLRLGLEGKQSPNLRLNIVGTTAVPQKSQPVRKMNILKESDYPKKGFPRTLVSLNILGIQISKITYGVYSLRNLTELNLSDNNIDKVPQKLGRLCLKTFRIANNVLGGSSSWQWLNGKNIKKSLRVLDLSGNQLEYFPPNIIQCENLVTLKIDNNNVKYVPFGLRRLRRLRTLNLSSNNLESLPSIFNDMRLDMLDVWGNNFKSYIDHSTVLNMPETSRIHSAPALWLLAARVVIQNKLPYSPTTLPWMLCDIMKESPLCACGKICFAGTVFERAALISFDNVQNLVFNRDRSIYGDVVLCGPKCVGRRQMVV